MERTRVGDVEIAALLDLEGGPPAADIYASAGDGLARYGEFIDGEGRFAINFSAFALRADGRTVLVDTGGGPERDSALLRELDAAGIAPDAVDLVVFTHLHWDHTGWNVDRETGRPTFPRARYLVPRIDWDLLSRREPRPPRTFARDVAPLEALGVLDLVEGERAVTPSITTLPAPGHTAGHTALVVSSQGERAYVLGDAFISAIDIAEPQWATTWDDDHEATVRTRRDLARRIDGTDAVLAISHPIPSLGRFVMVEGRRTWRGLGA